MVESSEMFVNNENNKSSSYIGHKTGDVRIMVYNILGYLMFPDRKNQPHLNAGPFPVRQKLEMELIRKYDPDVIGMQEYSADFNQNMTPLLENAGYKRVDVWNSQPDKHGNPVNFTPLFYRIDRVRLLDQGYLLYEGMNDGSSKSLTWAVFECLKTQKKFGAISTHFVWSDPSIDKETANQARVSNAKQILKVIDRLHRGIDGKYTDLPVFMGGDLNCFYNSDPFRVLQDSGLQWLYEIADEKDDSVGIKGYATYDENKGEFIACPVPKDIPRGGIDYIWLKQGITQKVHVTSYITVTDREALLSSDHCPRIADFDLL